MSASTLPKAAAGSAASPARSVETRALKWQIIGRLTADHADLLGRRDEPSARCEIELRIREETNTSVGKLPQGVRNDLIKQITDELLGFGPIQPLLDDTSVTEIMVNRFNRVYVERKGKQALTDVVFEDDAHVRRVIDRIIIP